MKETVQQAAYAEFRLTFVKETKRHPNILGLFYKSAKICFYCEYIYIYIYIHTQKQTLYNSDYLHD